MQLSLNLEIQKKIWLKEHKISTDPYNQKKIMQSQPIYKKKKEDLIENNISTAFL